ncbi:MAG: type III pantothenate kinase [Porticoccaceae bacterium]|nr:type III pantothenate kinase [Porticoccaceae bacterium]
MIAEIDIGNTRIKWRVRDGQRHVSRGVQPTRSILEGTPLALGDLQVISEARLCCVAMSEVGLKIQRQLFDQYAISARFAAVSQNAGGVVCGYHQLDSLGVDRWLALLAGYQLVAGAVVVVDAGSALTIDLVTADGTHLGGYIAPGQQLMRSALWQGTNAVKVPAVQVDEAMQPATNSAQAVALGGLLGAVAMVEKLSLQYAATPILTGGDGPLLSRALSIRGLHVKDLVLDGLAIEDVVFHRC